MELVIPGPSEARSPESIDTMDAIAKVSASYE